MAFVTRLVLYIGTPALILNALGSAEIDNSSFLRTGLATLTDGNGAAAGPELAVLCTA